MEGGGLGHRDSTVVEKQKIRKVGNGRSAPEGSRGLDNSKEKSRERREGLGVRRRHHRADMMS